MVPPWADPGWSQARQGVLVEQQFSPAENPATVAMVVGGFYLAGLLLQMAGDAIRPRPQLQSQHMCGLTTGGEVR